MGTSPSDCFLSESGHDRSCRGKRDLSPCGTWANLGEVGGGLALEERRNLMRTEQNFYYSV